MYNKKKERFVKLHTLIKSFLSPCLKFSSLCLPCSMPALVPALVSASVLALIPVHIFYPKNLAIWLSHHIPAPAKSAAFFLPCHCSVFYHKISALLLPLLLFSILLLLGSSPFRIFRQSLSGELWSHVSTNLAKHFCLFLAHNAYNLNNNNGLYN